MTDVDLTEFRRLSRPQGSCAMRTALEKLGKRERELVAAAMATPQAEIRHTAIVAWLKARGVEVRSEAVSRHRNSQCACDAGS